MVSRKAVAAAALMAGALSLVACSQATPPGQGSSSSPSAPAGAQDGSGGPVPTMADDATHRPEAPTLVDATAPTDACAAMDAVLQEALAQTPEGTAFTGATDSPDAAVRQQAWDDFATALRAGYRDRLVTAAGGDQTASHAVTALDTYVHTSAQLSSGEVTEYADPEQARKDLNAGKQPEVNPDYETAVNDRTQAHITLSECMPSWPVVF